MRQNLEQREYDITWQEESALKEIGPSWHAPNRAQGFRTYFTPEGIRVMPRSESGSSWRWGLSWTGYGKSGKAWTVPPAQLAASGHKVEYRRGAIQESYENTPEGLEQKFLLAAPPGASPEDREGKPATSEPPTRASSAGTDVAGDRNPMQAADSDDRIYLELSLWGDLTPRFSEDGQAIDFISGSIAVLHYAQLVVMDAGGRKLPAWMEGFVGNGSRGIRLVVDSHGASYPITIDPLATSPAWTVESNQADAILGFAVATAGDVNGDGFSDVIVGVPGFNAGQTDEGRAYLYLGSASGLSTTPAWTAESNTFFQLFGYSVATAGDVNGDGYSDVIVGTNSSGADSPLRDRAFVYLGSASGLSATAAWTAQATQFGSAFGASVASAGDVNGDGYSDVLVGEPYYFNGGGFDGRAHLYLGSAGGLSASAAWVVTSDQPSAELGHNVATAGDVNGDGYADVLVSSRNYDSGLIDEGRVSLYLGSASGLSATAAWFADGDQQQAYFGISASTAGDVNGDGYADVVIGAQRYDNGQTDEGIAVIFLGSITGLPATYSSYVECNQANALFGSSVATAGDVNGDGYSDVLVGAPDFSNGQGQEGEAFLYLGSAAGLASAPTWTAENNVAGSRLGTAVATAGDVNGDGYADVVVGAPFFGSSLMQSSEGKAYLYLGSPSVPATAVGWHAESDQAGAGMGYYFSEGGDVNGDGYADILTGAPGYNGIGRAYLYLGSPSGPSSLPAWTADGAQPGENFGLAVAIAGDVNGDGYSDALVGAPLFSSGESSEGRVSLFLGSASGLAATPAWTAEANEASAWFGFSVRTAGDVNGDGYADVVIGAPFYDSAGISNSGRAYLYLGSPTGLQPNPVWVQDGDQTNGQFGFSAGTAGDVNGDGYADVVVGEPSHAVHFYLGSPSGPVPSLMITETFEFGISVGTAGDVNGDGYADVLVGNWSGGNGPDVSLYLGGASGLTSVPAWNVSGSGDFASSVATAGDVNGDGYADVLVTSSVYGATNLYLGSSSGLPQTPSWVVVSPGPPFSTDLGTKLSGAGDVNGDGYSDVLLGDDLYANPENEEGGIFLYYGNGGPGLSLRPRQSQQDFFGFQPIAPGGQSNVPGSFALQITGRTPFGRSGVRLEWEFKPLGTLLNGASTIDSFFTDTGTAGASLIQQPIFLNPGPYHWRLRLRYNPARTPFAQRSRWITMPWHGWQEAHLTLGAFLGGWVWDDLDGDGVREGGEPGHAGATVLLVNSFGTIVDQKTTIGDGYYRFALPGGASSFQVRFQPPTGTSLTLQDQGGDDTNDSDPDPASGNTPLIGPPFTYIDATRWGAGLICNPPTLPILIVGARTLSTTTEIILDFTDPNPFSQVTGYNVYRSSQPQPPPAPWLIYGSDVTDYDPSTPNIQWSDGTGTNPPLGGVLYYQVMAYNHNCNAEGPR